MKLRLRRETSMTDVMQGSVEDSRMFVGRGRNHITDEDDDTLSSPGSASLILGGALGSTSIEEKNMKLSSPRRSSLKRKKKRGKTPDDGAKMVLGDRSAAFSLSNYHGSSMRDLCDTNETIYEEDGDEGKITECDFSIPSYTSTKSNYEAIMHGHRVALPTSAPHEKLVEVVLKPNIVYAPLGRRQGSSFSSLFSEGSSAQEIPPPPQDFFDVSPFSPNAKHVRDEEEFLTCDPRAPVSFIEVSEHDGNVSVMSMGTNTVILQQQRHQNCTYSHLPNVNRRESYSREDSGSKRGTRRWDATGGN